MLSFCNFFLSCLLLYSLDSDVLYKWLNANAVVYLDPHYYVCGSETLDIKRRYRDKHVIVNCGYNTSIEMELCSPSLHFGLHHLPDSFDSHDPARLAVPHLVNRAKIAASNFPTVHQILGTEAVLLLIKLQLPRGLHLK